MKKRFISAAIYGLAILTSSCGQPKETIGVSKKIISKDLPEEIDVQNAVLERNISENLKFLSSDELQGRKFGTPGIEKAAEYIEGQLERAGIKPFFDTYKSSFELEGVRGDNIVGFKEGSDPELKDEVIIIGAHYDHIGFGKKVGNDSIANGANDNAAGTTAVLELAKYFSNLDTKRSIIFALFSAEESGLIGSKKLAEKFKQDGLDPYLMFNIEMIGVPMKDKDYMAYVTGFDRSNLPAVFNEYAEKKVLGFLPDAEKFNLYQRSDNYAFAKVFDIPAHTVSSFDFTNYDYYHHVDDEFERMDTAHMEKLIEAIIPPLVKIANSEEKKVKLN